MNKSQYEQIQQRELNEALTSLVAQFPQLAGREVRIASILTILQQRSASNARAHALLNLLDTEELQAQWNVNRQRVAVHCAKLHKRWGIGRKIGNSWVLTRDEAEAHRPAAKAGRPKKLDSNTKGNKMIIISSPLGFPSTTISFNEIPFPADLSGAKSYVGHPATKALLEALGASTVAGKWAGPTIGESYIAVPLAQNAREGG